MLLGYTGKASEVVNDGFRRLDELVKDDVPGVKVNEADSRELFAVFREAL